MDAMTTALACLLALAPAAQEVAKLGLVLGAAGVEAKAGGSEDFKPLAAGSGVAAGTTIRVPAGVRAAFEFPDGTDLRVDEGTEFLLAEARKVELRKGRLYARIAKGAPFLIRTDFAPVTSESGEFDVQHLPPPKPGIQSLTTVSVFDGMAEVRSRRYGQKVTAGYACNVVGPQMNTPDSISEAALETQWVHALLRERGQAGPEVDWRARDLLRQLSFQAKDDPYEPAFRALGDLGIPVLAEYLGFAPVPIEAARRAAAARIVGDVATLRSAPQLLALLGNAEAEVRVQAARALSRVAGKDLGFPEAYWRGESRADGRKAWDAWVKENPAK